MKRNLAVISGFVLAVLIVIGGVLSGQHQTRSGVIPLKNNDVPGFAELLKISFESLVKDKLSTDSVNSLTAGHENENDSFFYEANMARADWEQKEDEDHEDENKENNSDEEKKDENTNRR